MRKLKVILLFIILLTLVSSALQWRLNIVAEKDLKGYSFKNSPPSLKLFTWKRWFSSGFQDTISKCLNDNFGLRNSLIRINNQYDYSLFRLIHADGYTRGKQGYLYQEEYIHEYTGKYFIGQKVIDKKLSRLKNVMDSLEAHHIPLLLVFEPGKASFYPEYIPGRFQPEKRAQTNYEYMTRRSGELGLKFIDLNSYFLQMKDTTRFPLFPRYGMHWSLYGVPYAVDTLVKAIEMATGRRLPAYATKPVISSSTPRGTDYDIGELLNLACQLPPTPGAYPTITFDRASSGSLSALVVADSYYVNIIETYGRKLFNSQDYWYYNRKVYPWQNNSPPVYVDKTNLRGQLLKHGLILLMVSEINLHCGFWNFADEAFLAFHPEIKDPLIYGIENDMRNDREWFRFIVNKARLQGRPLEEMIRDDASFTFYSNYNNLQGKSYWDSVYHLAIDIKNNAGWLAGIEKKARDRNIAVDSMVLLDAIYSYEQSKKNH
jgi:hypothetical protein